jgi:hypothetical protein
MSLFERLRRLSPATCCVCDRKMSVRELHEFRGMVDETVVTDVYCRACLHTHLVVCRECSSRWTMAVDGVCGDCTVRVYGNVG